MLSAHMQLLTYSSVELIVQHCRLLRFSARCRMRWGKCRMLD